MSRARKLKHRLRHSWPQSDSRPEADGEGNAAKRPRTIGCGHPLGPGMLREAKVPISQVPSRLASSTRKAARARLPNDQMHDSRCPLASIAGWRNDFCSYIRPSCAETHACKLGKRSCRKAKCDERWPVTVRSSSLWGGSGLRRVMRLWVVWRRMALAKEALAKAVLAEAVLENLPMVKARRFEVTLLETVQSRAATGTNGRDTECPCKQSPG